MVRILRIGTIILALAAALAPLPATWIEFAYSRRVYLAIQRRLTPWSNAVPVAVTDLLIAGAVVLAAMSVRRWFRSQGRLMTWQGLGHGLVVLASTASVVYLLFLAMWGLNYRREPLWARLDFDRARVTPHSVKDLARLVVGRVNALHPDAHAAGWPAWESLPAMLGPSYERVQRELTDMQPAVPGVPKASVLTFYFERAGVSGMVDPFALEVVVDRSQLPVERPFVAAHEWAHLAGYATEAEANFIGWLVCLQGPPAAEYSGDLSLLIYLLSALPDSDRREVAQAISAGPRRDILAIQRRVARGWPWLQRPVWWVYDRYLRANRVDQGVRSYGTALELMVGTRFEAGWVPGRRPNLEAGR
ncbi:MAG TPA: DUF3810 family protein [Vicinamibacterales bacterium]